MMVDFLEGVVTEEKEEVLEESWGREERGKEMRKGRKGRAG